MSQINEILDNIKLPQIMKVSQTFDNTKLDDVEGDLRQDKTGDEDCDNWWK